MERLEESILSRINTACQTSAVLIFEQGSFSLEAHCRCFNAQQTAGELQASARKWGKHTGALSHVAVLRKGASE